MSEAQAKLEQGVRYRGRIIAFSPVFVTDTKVKDGFVKVGFKDVLVWMHEADLPADWPPEARADVATADQTQAWVEGTWDKPSGMYPAHGTMWTLYDYWPKDNAKPVQVDGDTKTAPGVNWKPYAIVAGGVAVISIILLAATSSD